jgi:DNA-binding phage protein
MPNTRPFRQTVVERAKRDADFRVGLLTEASECFLAGDTGTAKVLLRDYVNATLGFVELGRLVDKKPESLMRMLSAAGNPRAANLAQVLSSLQSHEGITLQVAASR